jgi:hypothetical protein
MKNADMPTSILEGVTPTPQALRRAVLVVGSATIVLLAYAGPASADVPVGWSDPKPVPPLHFLLTFVGIPLLITLGIFAAIYLPGVVRGESVAPAGARADDQWFGGRRDTAELESATTARSDESGGAGGPGGPDGPDTDRDTGGAGGTW